MMLTKKMFALVLAALIMCVAVPVYAQNAGRHWQNAVELAENQSVRFTLPSEYLSILTETRPDGYSNHYDYEHSKWFKIYVPSENQTIQWTLTTTSGEVFSDRVKLQIGSKSDVEGCGCSSYWRLYSPATKTQQLTESGVHYIRVFGDDHTSELQLQYSFTTPEKSTDNKSSEKNESSTSNKSSTNKKSSANSGSKNTKTDSNPTDNSVHRPTLLAALQNYTGEPIAVPSTGDLIEPVCQYMEISTRPYGEWTQFFTRPYQTPSDKIGNIYHGETVYVYGITTETHLCWYWVYIEYDGKFGCIRAGGLKPIEDAPISTGTPSPVPAAISATERK